MDRACAGSLKIVNAKYLRMLLRLTFLLFLPIYLFYLENPLAGSSHKDVRHVSVFRGTANVYGTIRAHTV